MEYVSNHYDVQFISRDSESITIQVRGAIEKYTVLKVNHFSSDRKMMSIIVRSSDGVIYNFCKGADTVIQKKLSQLGQVEINLIESLDSFAR